MQVQLPGSHFDHMLRQTRQHHIHLSSMADSKANMLLTMSSIVVTLAMPFLLKEELHLVALVLIPFSVLAILLAAYTTFPRLHHVPEEERSFSSKGFNPLFFGHFTTLPYEEYEHLMEELLNDPSKTYEVQVREIYSLGIFLKNRKYRYLRYAYFSFLSGIVLSSIIFVITFTI